MSLQLPYLDRFLERLHPKSFLPRSRGGAEKTKRAFEREFTFLKLCVSVFLR